MSEVTPNSNIVKEEIWQKSRKTFKLGKQKAENRTLGNVENLKTIVDDPARFGKSARFERFLILLEAGVCILALVNYVLTAINGKGTWSKIVNFSVVFAVFVATCVLLLEKIWSTFFRQINPAQNNNQGMIGLIELENGRSMESSGNHWIRIFKLEEVYTQIVRLISEQELAVVINNPYISDDVIQFAKQAFFEGFRVGVRRVDDQINALRDLLPVNEPTNQFLTSLFVELVLSISGAAGFGASGSDEEDIPKKCLYYVACGGSIISMLLIAYMKGRRMSAINAKVAEFDREHDALRQHRQNLGNEEDVWNGYCDIALLDYMNFEYICPLLPLAKKVESQLTERNNESHL